MALVQAPHIDWAAPARGSDEKCPPASYREGAARVTRCARREVRTDVSLNQKKEGRKAERRRSSQPGRRGGPPSGLRLLAAGSTTEKMAPVGWLAPTRTLPPCASTSRLTIDRPSPVPSCSRVDEEST